MQCQKESKKKTIKFYWKGKNKHRCNHFQRCTILYFYAVTGSYSSLYMNQESSTTANQLANNEQKKNHILIQTYK